jgi:hypothetical protein
LTGKGKKRHEHHDKERRPFARINFRICVGEDTNFIPSLIVKEKLMTP